MWTLGTMLLLSLIFTEIKFLLKDCLTWMLQGASCSIHHESESENRSVRSNSLQPHQLHNPWNFSGQNTGVGSHSLLQGTFSTQGLNPGLPHHRWILYQLSRSSVTQSCPTLCNPMDYSTPGFPVHPNYQSYSNSCPSSQWCSSKLQWYISLLP